MDAPKSYKDNIYTQQSVPYVSNGKELILQKFEFGNETKKISPSACFVPNNYGDRFIPRRYVNGDVFLPISQKPDSDFIQMMKRNGYWRQRGMKKRLEAIFRINSRANVLNFHDLLTKQVSKQSLDQRLIWSQLLEDASIDRFDWPCFARKKPAAVDNSTYDLGQYNFYSHLNIMSWSSKGNIAASFGKDLVIWMPTDEINSYEIEGITTLAFNSDGKLLALGIKTNLMRAELQIWDLSSNSMAVFEASFKYDLFDQIRCITWDPTNEYIISGMFNGKIYVHKLTRSLKNVKQLNDHVKCIKSLKFSSNRTFLASSDANGKVIVKNFKSFEDKLDWKSECENEALIAWHPWRDSFLIISSTYPATIYMFDVMEPKLMACYHRLDDAYKIEAITFNVLSAELVVSITSYDKDGYPISYEILVLASLDCLVDVLNLHDSSVKLLMWNSDGTMLATAGDDNKLNIWNFFGCDHNKPVKVDESKKNNISKFILGNPMLR